MTKKIIFLWVLIVLSNQVLSQLDNFHFNGFLHKTSNISLGGIAEIEENGILKLTNDTPRLLGNAFYPDLIKFKNSTNGKAFSFSTAFAFAIVPNLTNLGGHGFAFTISSTKDLKGAPFNQYLGLSDGNTGNGNFSNHFVAVEFDTDVNYELKDNNSNHIGIDINSLVSNASVCASYFQQGNSSKQKLNLLSGKTIQAWIDYDSMANELNVTLSLSSSKPISSILSFPVDLSPIFKDSMYIGFSASNGRLASSHYIFGWSFKMNGQAQSLDLSSLPSLPVVPEPKKNHTALIRSVSVSAVLLAMFSTAIALYLIHKIKNMDVMEDWELDIGPQRFSYQELKQATRGFREKGLLGFGGSGRVYKGTLPNSNTQVAVKQISQESKQGLREFASEITSIGRLRHRNLVQLLGWCRRGGDLLLVYDFMPNGSLDKHIYDEPKMILTWGQRFKIIKGVASGLLYLHEEWEQTVIHRDIKAANVLLDAELNGRLGDFGLAKLCEHGSDTITTKVVGTLGYLAPELTRTGKPTTSSDVFAFGALLLEVVCGRKPIEHKALPEELFLVEWVWDRWKEGSILEAVDPRLREVYNVMEVIVVLKLGLMCSNNSPKMRPSMRQVVRYLDGEVRLPDILVPPGDYEDTKGGGVVLENYVDFSPSSSCCEKVSTWSSVGDGDVDIEAGSASQHSSMEEQQKSWRETNLL